MESAIYFRMSSIKIVLVALGISAILAGCGPVHKPFATLDARHQIKTGTLAVISGDAAEPSLRVIGYFTEEVKRRGKFRVIGQEEIEQRVPNYPVTIKKVAWKDENKPVLLAKDEQDKLDSMQARIKADYLFVVWTTGLVKYGVGKDSSTYVVGLRGNLFEYPSAKVIGYSVFDTKNEQTLASTCLFTRLRKTEGDIVNETLKNAAKDMADKFLSVTKAEKPEK